MPQPPAAAPAACAAATLEQGPHAAHLWELKDEVAQLRQRLEALQARHPDASSHEDGELVAPLAPYTARYCRTPIAAVLRPAEGGGGTPPWVGATLRIGGWVRTGRSAGSGSFAFLEVNDGSCLDSLQVTVERGVGEAAPGGLRQLMLTSTCVLIEGVVQRTPPGTQQQVELKASSVLYIGPTDPAQYPLAKTGKAAKRAHSLEFLREVAHLRPRTNLFGAVARLRSSLAAATHAFFQDRGFLYVHTPIITGSDCEGAGEMLQVTTLLPGAEAVGAAAALPRTPGGRVDYSRDFFSRPAFLTVSGQLSGECLACALSSVYTFGPTFRAENSHTARHVAEFWQIEPEVAWCDLQGIMQCAEDYIRHCCRWVLERCRTLHPFSPLDALLSPRADIEFISARVDPGCLARLQQVAGTPFVRLSYSEAVEVLEGLVASGKKTFQFPVAWGSDLQSEHERCLAEQVYGQPVIVHDYPRDIKAFYMRQNEDGRTVAAMDVLVPKVGELIGGSQREERLGRLEARMAELGMQAEAYRPYLDLRRYGSVPHSGFGLGFERLLMFVTGIENIRDTIPFPRTAGSLGF